MALGGNLKKNIKKAEVKPLVAKKVEAESNIHFHADLVSSQPIEEYHDHEPIIQKEAELMLVVFPVGDEYYAMTIDKVSEVIKINFITKIPQAPEAIIGVTNIRGEVFAIADLAIKLTENQQPNKLPPLAMVINAENFKIAIALDKVPETIKVKESAIEDPARFLPQATLDMGFIIGVFRLEKKMIMLLDTHHLISQFAGSETIPH